jgi:hypothetical protein
MNVAIELDIFSRIIDASNPTLSVNAAKALLELSYPEADHARIAELSAKSNEGTLSGDERRELEGYVFVGDVISLLQSKARLSLKTHTSAA